MLFCGVAVNCNTAALQHRSTKNAPLLLTNQDFDIRISDLTGFFYASLYNECHCDPLPQLW